VERWCRQLDAIAKRRNRGGGPIGAQDNAAKNSKILRLCCVECGADREGYAVSSVELTGRCIALP
jgi:hypothetical protein